MEKYKDLSLSDIDEKTKILKKLSLKENKIFYTTFLIIFVILSIIGWDKVKFEKVTTNLLDSIITNFGFLYLIIVLIIALVCLFLCCSSYGNIKLGKDNSKPEYSNLSWFSMLFSAGMGVGLVFFGVAEPMTHYVYPVGIEGGTKEAIDFAFKTSFFHWGIHPWAIYSFLALAMAYFQFRKGEKGLVSSLFSPILKGKSYERKIKDSIDVIAILATITGVATTLGLGALQINSGLNHLFNIPNSITSQIIIIAVVTVIFIASALGSLDKGIKTLSNINVFISILLLLMVIVLGPTISIFNVFSENLGNYLNNFLKISLKTNSFGDNKWMSAWTIFYWSNWVAWTPFVGTFIARISKGRTIREFVIGVVVIPSIVSFVWFSAFGTLGITLGKEFATVAVENTETALFLVFAKYKFGALMSGIAILLLGSFFVTSADSATYVLGMMSSDGDLNPPTYKKLIWGIAQSLLAIALIFAGGLNMLKTASIIIAFPLLILFPIMIFTMFYSLKRDMYIKKQIALRNELRKMSLEEISDLSDAIKSLKK
ncbi:BCCT family transporter [Candidatus Cetobacterium colombiensis]|uniref:BCCT family transporter n=1 Tax=Candidatus Cetobacterium colombiensis TaxID=3073100 RepID=A0ABU4WCU2_9FUSO|nr:BCCT family transporter [Candidatus Cetobacterium colombiensis]MDX8336847.1 BCCT family transporter [Candidatus Cetobacterium colombiensis]